MIKLCKICNKEKKHFAKGMCQNCYNQTKYRDKHIELLKRYRESHPEYWKEYYIKNKLNVNSKEVDDGRKSEPGFNQPEMVGEHLSTT
jgi:predicted amidophosphoribosyltransferase